MQRDFFFCVVFEDLSHKTLKSHKSVRGKIGTIEDSSLPPIMKIPFSSTIVGFNYVMFFILYPC